MRNWLDSHIQRVVVNASNVQMELSDKWCLSRVCKGPVLSNTFTCDTDLGSRVLPADDTKQLWGQPPRGVADTPEGRAGRASEGSPKELEMQFPLSMEPRAWQEQLPLTRCFCLPRG